MRINKHLGMKLANMSFRCSLLIIGSQVGVDVAPNTLGWWLLVGTGALVLAHSLKRPPPRFSSLVFGVR